MALDDCIRKVERAGYPISDRVKRALKEALRDGLTDEQAVRRAILAAHQNVYDIVGEARKQGAGITPVANPVTDVARFQAGALENVKKRQGEINREMADLSDELTDISAVEGKIQSMHTGREDVIDMTATGRFIYTDLTSDEQVLDRMIQLTFEPELRQAAEVLGLKGKTANEMLTSFREMQARKEEILSQIAKLTEEKVKQDEQISTIFHGKNQKLFQLDPDVPKLKVLHNMNEGKLKFTDDLGGLAVPSLAVLKDGQILEGFGEITFIGTEDLGDPAKVPIFDADGYTVRFPSPEYKPALARDMDPIIKEIVAWEAVVEERADTSYYVERHMRDHPNPQLVIWKMLESPAARAWFLASQHGEKPRPVMRKAKPRFVWGWDQEIIDFFESAPNIFEYQWEDPRRHKLLKEAAEVVRRAAVRSIMGRKTTSKTPFSREEAESIFESGAFLNSDGSLSETRYRELLEDSKRKGTEEVDDLATLDRIESRLQEGTRMDEFKVWVENMIVPAMGEPRIKIGNKWEPYNLDNIVRKMRGKLKGTEFMDTMMNEGLMRALAAHRFKKLEEMRQRAEFVMAPGDEVTYLRDEAQTKMMNWTVEMGRFYTVADNTGYVDSYAAADAARRAVVRWATAGPRHQSTVNDLEEELIREGFQDDMPEWILDEGMDAAMTWLAVPVPYFEAKPQRAVQLEEFAGAVIPSNASPQTRAILQKRGIPYKEYQVASLAELADDFVGPPVDQQEIRKAAVEEFTQQLNNKGERTLFQSEIGFTSGLLTAAKTMPRERGTAQEMMGTLLKQPNVRKQEYEWIGLPEWAEAKGSFTRDELIDFIRLGGIQVQESVYAGPPIEPYVPRFEPADDNAYYAYFDDDEQGRRDAETEMQEGTLRIYDVSDRYDYHDRWFRVYHDTDAGTVNIQTDEQYLDENNKIRTREKWFQVAEQGDRGLDYVQFEINKYIKERELPEGALGPAKWTQYTLPAPQRGAMAGIVAADLNHREIILHMPEELIEYTEENVQLIDDGYRTLSPQSSTNEQRRQNDLLWFFDVPGNVLQISKKQYPTAEEAKRHIIEDKKGEKVLGREYQSHAYDIPNIMVWMRVTDRKGPNGEKILFVEEVQSDLHQEGQKVGYMERGTVGVPGVPDFPFKGDAWGALAMKRIIRLAAEGNYDQIAWTTGEQQNERWGEEDVHEMRWDPRDSTMYYYDENDRLIETTTVRDDGELEQLVGAARYAEMQHQINQAEQKYEIMAVGFVEDYPAEARVPRDVIILEKEDPFIGERERAYMEGGAGYVLVDQNGEILRHSTGNYHMGEYYGDAEEIKKDMIYANTDSFPTLTNVADIGDSNVMKQFYDQLLVNVTNKAARKLDKKAKVKRGGILMEGGDMPWRMTISHDGEKYWVEGSRWAQGPRVRLSQNFDNYGDAEEFQGFLGSGYANAVHGMDVTADMIANAMEGQTLFQGERGSITFDEQNRAIIRLSQSRDLSTFLHESAHLYLEMMGDLVELPSASDQLKDDYAKILTYLGVNSRREIGTDQHELFARSFEAYLREGKAPTAELQDMFTTFKGWLVRVYDIITKLLTGTESLTPEIRGVFDRMIASRDAIAQSEGMMEYVQLYNSAEEMGVSQEVFNVYKRAIQEAHDDAVDLESKKMIKAMRWGQEQWWKDELAKIEDEVRAEAEQMNVYIALSVLQKGKLPSGEKPPYEPFKLDKQTVLDALYGSQATLNEFPRPYIYTVKEGGVDVDLAAGTFGFESGKEMLAAIKNAPKMEVFIRDEARARMEQLHPDPMNSPELIDDAVKAVHSEKRGKVIAAELRALREQMKRDEKIVEATKAQAKREEREARDANKAQIPDRQSVAEIKAAAALVIAGKRIRDVKPHNYLNAERKAGRLAFEALEKKDYQEAYRQKRLQVMNFWAYKAAQKALDQARRDQRYLKTFDKPRKRARMGKAGVLDQIDQILENISLKQVSEKRLDRIPLERELIRAVEAGELVMPDNILASMTHPDGTNWRELTIEEFAGIRDVIKQLEHQAKTDLEIIINGEKQVIQEAVDEVSESIIAAGVEQPILLGDEKPKHRLRRNVREGFGHWLRSSSIARILDGAGFGAMTRKVIMPIRRAHTEKLIPRTAQADRDVAAIFTKHYNNDELSQLSKELEQPLLGGHALSKSDVLALALNWGSETNRRAVLQSTTKDKHGNKSLVYTEQGVAQALSTLDARDWAFVQDIWDYQDSYWAEIAETERRRRGVAPKRVEPMAFEITSSDGQRVQLRGGYHPLRYDRRHGGRITEKEFQDFYQRMTTGGYVTASTRAGATYDRKQNHGMVVRLSLNSISHNLHEVIRDLTLGDEVNLANRILTSEEVRNAAENTGNGELIRELQLWLSDAAVGELPAQSVVEKGLSWVRVGWTKSKLAFNVFVTALQLTGVFQSMAVIGTRTYATGFGKFISNPADNYKMVMEKSVFMQTRYGEMQTWDKDVSDTSRFLRSFFGDVPTKFRTNMDRVAHLYFWPIAKMQSVVDVTTWMGAYEKAINDPEIKNEQEAIYYADSQVEAAQTSGLFSDRSGLERGTLGTRTRQSQFVRLWTTLISYMLAKGNIAYEKGVAFKKAPTIAGARDLAMDYMMLFMLEGMASALLYGNWPGDEDEDETFVGWTAKVTIDSVTAGIPLLREYNAARYGAGNTAIGSIFNDAWNFNNQLMQGELDEPLVKSGIKTFGTLFHLPASQINRSIEAVFDEPDANWYNYIIGDTWEE